MSTFDLLPVLLGILLVVTAASLALIPLVRDQAPVSAPDPADDRGTQRYHLYRQVLELEFDYQMGKLSRDDLDALSASLLSRAATLFGGEGQSPASVDDEVEREIAAARRAFAQHRAAAGATTGRR